MENPPPEPVGFRSAEETGPCRAGRGDPYVVVTCTYIHTYLGTYVGRVDGRGSRHDVELARAGYRDDLRRGEI